MRLPALLLSAVALSFGGDVTLRIEQPMPPPDWALAERALFKAYGDAAREFAGKYLDERGYIRAVLRWGGNDGPDDAMENFALWPLVYALGGPGDLIDLYSKAWEGHLRQYTEARASTVEMARDGMYHKEFVTSFDWEHTGEGLAAFYFYGLSRPADPRYLVRMRRFAGFYMGEDPGAPNYDPKAKIIRSLHNGSRGAKITEATVNDWGGDPVPGHPERLDRYRSAGNIRGDHPLNLGATTLAMSAYALTGERKYRDWVLQYAGAWRDRVIANGGNIPTNIGLDGRIGSEWGGKWYGGTFGWNFYPESNTRNYYMRGARTGFGAGFLLTGDPAWYEPLVRQIANLYAAKKVENGRVLLPNKHGDKGWYGYLPNLHGDVERDLYLWSMDPTRLDHLTADPWIRFLTGKNPDYPQTTLRADLERVRSRVAAIRADASTPDTRAADDPQRNNPVASATLVHLTTGGNDPGTSGNLLHCRLRYFDPVERRAGLPPDVAALVEKIGADEIVVTIVNTTPVHARRLVVRAGAYAEHQFRSVTIAGKTVPVDSNEFRLDLAPGAGDKLTIAMKRYANQPSLALPW